jgi:hypothetical protein
MTRKIRKTESPPPKGPLPDLWKYRELEEYKKQQELLKAQYIVITWHLVLSDTFYDEENTPRIDKWEIEPGLYCRRSFTTFDEALECAREEIALKLNLSATLSNDTAVTNNANRRQWINRLCADLSETGRAGGLLPNGKSGCHFCIIIKKVCTEK